MTTGAQIKTLIDQGKFEDARQAVRQSTSPKKAAMLDRIDIEEARDLIKKQKYPQARALLIASKDPAADQLLSRLNAMDQSAAPSGSGPSFTTKFLIIVLLFFVGVVPGIIALAAFTPEAKKHPDAPGAQQIIRFNKYLFWIILAGLLAFGAFGILTWISLPK